MIWGSFLAFVLSMAFVKQYFGELGEVIDILVVAHFVLTIAILLVKSKDIKGILIAALVARFALLVWSIYFNHIFELPNSGIDAPIYMAHAIDVSQDMTLWYRYLRTGLYSRLLGTLFFLTGPSQMLAQYVNVLFGLSTLIVLHRTMVMLEIPRGSRMPVLMVAAFFPNSMIMSSILLREILPTFFLALSLYLFSDWFLRGKLSLMLGSLVTLVVASAFHSGLIGILPAYGFALLFYKHRYKRFVFTPRSLLALGLILGVAVLVLGVFRDSILSNFRNIRKPSDVFPLINTREGDAAYLTRLMVNSFAQAILYTPLRLLYFFFSPLPFEWRGATDAITFLLDASFYFYVLYVLFRWRRRYKSYRPLMMILSMGLLGTSIIFALGTGNAGTAFRHRQKLTPLLLLMLGIAKQQRVVAFETFRRKAQLIRADQALR